MITGYVSRAWARKNHSSWYEAEMSKIYQEELKTSTEAKEAQSTKIEQKPA